MKSIGQKVASQKLMGTNKDLTLNELHNRAYSIYDSKDDEEAALKELHRREYMILDEEETINLFIEYYDEFDSLSHEVSFVSLQQSLKTQDLFKADILNPQPVKRLANVEFSTILSSLIEYKEKSKIPQQTSDLDIDNPSEHYFYITVSDLEFGRCDVVGTYDPLTGTFKIREGSIFPLEVSSYDRYSAADIQRRIFLRKNCRKKVDGYYLRKDYVCKSPDQAAMYVWGGEVDGWSKWTDNNGRTLKEIYK